MFLGALQELIQAAGLSRRELAAIPLLICMPAAERSPRIREVASGLLGIVQRRAGAAIAPGSGIVTRGNAGAFIALQSMLPGLQRGAPEAYILACLESYFDLETLSALDAAGRLKSARTLDGFAPGECATAALIEAPGSAARRGAKPLLGLGAPGFGVEERPVGSGEASTAKGLIAAVRAAAGADARPFAWAIGDLNGEMYRSAEWGMARVRLPPLLGGIQHLWHPADCLGDVGAATGGVLLAIAAGAFEKETAPADRALLFAGADDGTRACLIVTAP
jgi:3-oxoacyl-[acyl-carrier-protein] synthase-1